MSLGPALISSFLSLATAASGWREVPVPELLQQLQATAPGKVTPAGIQLDIGAAGATLALLMPGVRAVELDVQTDGIFDLVYAALEQGGGRLRGPPLRHVPVRPGATTVHLDMVETARWTTASVPMLFLDGSGHVTIRSIRILPPPASASEAADLVDSAKLWGPESFGPTTINSLTTPFWSATNQVFLTEALAGAMIAVAAVVLVAIRLLRRRWAPAMALAVAAGATAMAWNVMFLLRYVPAMDLAPSVGTEARLREGFQLAPELGEVAPVARSAIGPDERVGVIADEQDWFTPQTLCFVLAPRKCVRIRPGESEHAGISGIEHLRTDELSSVVSFSGANALPPGFVPRVQVTKRAVIARRP